MPNWCSNFLVVSSEDKPALHEFLKNVTDEKENFTFAKLVPVSEDSTIFETANIWGTKWDASDSYINIEIEACGQFTVAFSTAWGPALAWLEKVAPMYPSINFNYTYEESGNMIAGIMRAESGSVAESKWFTEGTTRDYVNFLAEIQEMDIGEVEEQYSEALFCEVKEEYAFEINLSKDEIEYKFFAEFESDCERYKFIVELSEDEYNAIGWDEFEALKSIMAKNEELFQKLKFFADNPVVSEEKPNKFEVVL